MIATTHSAALVGLRAVPVAVDVDAGEGCSQFVIVGLPDAAIRESRDRVRSAVQSSGFYFPQRRTVVSLSPADLKKQGPAYDLPMALAILGATEQIPAAAVAEVLVVGELSLEGATRPVTGCLPLAAAARPGRFRALIVPRANAAEAAVGAPVPVYAVGSLGEAAAFLAGTARLEPTPASPAARSDPAGAPNGPDLVDVRGQERAKRALTIAAAGGHHLLMIGPPGTGKTMLARRIVGVMPPFRRSEAYEATAVHSVAGLEPNGLLPERPFRAPHHTVSAAGLLGGGVQPTPGEVSLAHGGVLFLDELPEFDRRTLNGLRQPLESGHVVIRRVGYHVRFPARFLMIAAMNPCPCVAFLPCAVSARKQPPPVLPNGPEHLGHHLRLRRHALGHSVQNAAEEIGVDQTSIRNWEQGRSDPAVRERPALYAYLGFCPAAPGASLGVRLKLLREANGLSHRKLAEQLDLDEATVSRLERGTAGMSQRALAAAQELFAGRMRWPAHPGEKGKKMV